MRDLLPLGSVVLLKGGKKRIMVCGRIQTKDDEKQLYDYSACYYPEGIIDAKELFLFNNEDIDTVFYVGMQDIEEFKFRDYINEQLKKLEEEGKA